MARKIGVVIDPLELDENWVRRVREGGIQLLGLHPAALYYLLLDHGNHGIAAAKSEGANEKEHPEKFQKDHFCILLSAVRADTRPMTPHRAITRKVLTFKKAVSTKERPMIP